MHQNLFLLEDKFNQMEYINPTIIEGAMNYGQYWELIEGEFALGRTTGPIQNDAMLEYTKLNIARMKRLDKTTKIKEETINKLNQVKKNIIWLTLTEAWCGDAAQVIPILQKMANLNENISLLLLLRDEHLDIMDAFLTNGGRSIPKVIILDKENGQVLGSWGPRPTEAQQLVMDARQKAQNILDPMDRKRFWDETKKNTQLWYAKDKTISVQSEMLEETLKVV